MPFAFSKTRYSFSVISIEAITFETVPEKLSPDFIASLRLLPSLSAARVALPRAWRSISPKIMGDTKSAIFLFVPAAGL